MTNRIDTAVAPSDPVQHPLASASQETERVRVWAPFMRFFHWGLALAVLIAFVTEDELQGLHTAAGYTVMGLIGARLLWGLVGPRHARWWDFVRGPRAVLAYLGDVLRGHPARYLGHNPAGGAMAIALIAGLIATTLTGLAALSNEGMEEVHEALAYGTLFLVPLHLLGVALASLQHKENLVRAMIDGYKRK
jgi:cytochrome b